MVFDIEVNNKKIKARKGETILSALNRNGIKVPTLCFMEDLLPTGACRICVVEVEGREDLVPSCSQIVEEWMKIKTHSPRVIKARKTIVELLLSNHPDDCLYCERNGNCELQKLSIDLNILERRIPGNKNILKADRSSSSLIRDPKKCILCGRCVRVCEEIVGVTAIDFSVAESTISVATLLFILERDAVIFVDPAATAFATPAAELNLAIVSSLELQVTLVVMSCVVLSV